MDLKTITATLALLGGTSLGCGGDAAKKTEVKTEKVETKTTVETKGDATKTTAEVKTPDAKEVVPAAGDAKAGEKSCGEGKCGEGSCGGAKKTGDGKEVPVDAAKTGDAAKVEAKADAKKT